MKAPLLSSRATYAFSACPACGETLWCEVVIDPHLSAPEIRSLQDVTVTVDPKIVGMAVTHRCGGADFPAVVEQAQVSS